MAWPKHTIYWTICSTFLIGWLLGSIVTVKGFEPRAEFEIFTTYQKIKGIIAIILIAGAVYLAGTEYHELKRKIKEIK